MKRAEARARQLFSAAWLNISASEYRRCHRVSASSSSKEAQACLVTYYSHILTYTAASWSLDSMAEHLQSKADEHIPANPDMQGIDRRPDNDARHASHSHGSDTTAQSPARAESIGAASTAVDPTDAAKQKATGANWRDEVHVIPKQARTAPFTSCCVYLIFLLLQRSFKLVYMALLLSVSNAFLHCKLC